MIALETESQRDREYSGRISSLLSGAVEYCEDTRDSRFKVALV